MLQIPISIPINSAPKFNSIKTYIHKVRIKDDLITASWIPGTRLIAFSTDPAQAEQVIPKRDKPPLKSLPRSQPQSSLKMIRRRETSLSVPEQRGNAR
ncbi:unnamed protein product [Arabis nemorensis]|uniref:Uncharacterized protein n=1 Tax=Arabis nemorensis TaxID=586526 RepID=A0A565CBI3_9BRAS|nr:unnamed protein product [Arabis nemorensis]